ncbi:MAG: ATP-binding cassette domain-containing protein [Lachnospiraceae bacterium]|nr:ATP-binding cassette domain-containing protein [Lachnospiraceae bacterium]
MSSRLECKNLTKDYGNVMALSDVNLTLESGRIVGLLGPNGSGKTTLIKLANGLLQPTSGEILLNGLKPGPETKAFVSYLPDANYLPDWMNVEALVGMFDDFYADFDRVLDEAVFINRGNIVFHRSVDEIRETEHKSVDELFREVFRC